MFGISCSSKTRIYTLQNHKINYTGYLSRMFCIFFPTVSKSRISRVRETLRHSNQYSNAPLWCVLILVLSRPFDLKHCSTTSRFYKRNAVKSLRLTRSRALARARESVRNFSSSKVKIRFFIF